MVFGNIFSLIQQLQDNRFNILRWSDIERSISPIIHKASDHILEDLGFFYEKLRIDSSMVEGMHRDVSRFLQVANACKQAYWSGDLRFEQNCQLHEASVARDGGRLFEKAWYGYKKHPSNSSIFVQKMR